MRWRFNGDTCCECGAGCPQECICQIGEWFDFTNGPDQIAITDIVVPASYRYYSAEYVYPCPQENCDDLSPDDAPLQYVTPHYKVGYKTIGSYVLTKDETISDEFVCGWSVDITDFPTATTADECWGQNFNKFGTKESPDTVYPPSASGTCPTNAYWAYCPQASPVNGNTLLEFQSPAQGLGLKLYSGLRRIELVTETYGCGRPTLLLYPQQIWSPLKSDVVPAAHFDDYTCPTVQNPVFKLVGSDGSYWEIDGWQVDDWDSTYQIFSTASFSIGLRVKDGPGETPYGAFGKDLENVMEYPIDEQMPMGSAFPCDNCGATGNAGNCGFADDFIPIPSDASYIPVTGTEKCGATVFTNTGPMCECWSDPTGASIGCLPFPVSGYQPDESELITDFALRYGDDILVQNGTSYWGGIGGKELTIPTSGGDVGVGSGSGTRTVSLDIPNGPGYYVPFAMDSCGGEGITIRGESGDDFFTMMMPYGGDCNECVDTSVTVGCCEFADGTVSTTLGETPCNELGGTYAGDDSVCPPTGCCTLPDGSYESDVTQAYCTAQSGSWTSADCPTGCCVIAGEDNRSGITQQECTAFGGTWTEGVECDPKGYCQDPLTGVVTPDIESDECTGTWSATPFPTGCCAIVGSPDQPDKNQVECSVLGGTWTEGANCDGTGWCINDTDGSVTSGVEENDCTGTWSATQPTMGCCDISGTQNPDVAQQWCTAQGGVFNAGDCVAPPFDPTTSSRIKVNDIIMVGPDGGSCGLDFTYFEYNFPAGPLTGSYTTAATKTCPMGGSVYGDDVFASNSPPTPVGSGTETSLVFGATTYQVQVDIIWTYSGTNYHLRGLSDALPISGLAGCPTSSLSGMLTSFVDVNNNYSQGCDGSDESDLTGSYNITLECQ